MRPLLVVVVLSIGCTTDSGNSQIIDSPVVPFNELFAPPDTVRLDPAIIIGSISFLDVNQEEDFLITDALGRDVYLFSSSGEHLRTFSVQTCLPDQVNNTPFSARFLGKDYIVVTQFSGAVVVFGNDGRCVSGTRRLADSSHSFCTSADSIYFLGIPIPVLNGMNNNTVAVYSPELERAREIPVGWPKFPVLNVGRTGIMGRSIDCFDDRSYYTYLESMDAVPAPYDAELTQQRPEFFEERPRDISLKMSREKRREEWNRYLTTDGIFALTSSVRMVVYRNVPPRWRPETIGSAQFSYGISVASNDGRFLPRSTTTSIMPITAGYGVIYSRGDNELLPDGNVGNPVILKYRFIPPRGTHD